MIGQTGICLTDSCKHDLPDRSGLTELILFHYFHCFFHDLLRNAFLKNIP